MTKGYKDSLFRSLFNDSAAALELYNCIKGKRLALNAHKVEINTLPETLFNHRKNDVSFLLDNRLVVICEHQSTPNENMPLRFLPYVNSLMLDCLPDKALVYGKKRLSLPAPEFAVIYNGEAEYTDRKLRLSDAYLVKRRQVKLELVVDVYNINAGHNEKRVKRSGLLSGYVLFVEAVKRYKAEVKAAHPGLSAEVVSDRAVSLAISWCLEEGILRDFFGNLRTEDKMMLTTEWKLEDALAVEREEGLEEGWEKGMQQKQQEILSLLDQVTSLEQLREQLTVNVQQKIR